MRATLLAVTMALTLAACGGENYGEPLGSIPGEAVANQTTGTDDPAVNRVMDCFGAEDEVVAVQDGSVLARGTVATRNRENPIPTTATPHPIARIAADAGVARLSRCARPARR